MLASKRFVRREVHEARNTLAQDVKYLREQIGSVSTQDFYGLSIFRLLSGTEPPAPAAAHTLFGRIEKIEQRLDRLFAYLGVVEKTDSARTYVSKKQKGK